MRIVAFDQVLHPISLPALDPLVARDGVIYVGKLFVPYQHLHAVFSGEAGNQSFAMLVDTAHQIIRYAGIERALRLAGWHVDEITAIAHANPLGPGTRCAR